jgi:hypothetical protein
MPIFSILQREISTRCMQVDASTRQEAILKARACDALEVGDFRERTDHEVVCWSDAVVIDGSVVRSVNLKETN